MLLPEHLALCILLAVAGPSTAQDDAGRRAIELCRAGNPTGLPVLRELATRHPEQGWAMANLGLGLRLLGRYDEARSTYQGMLARHGRPAWILNDLALVEQATGDGDAALALYLEGSRDSADIAAADTCRTNAAVLLIARGGATDRLKAEALLRDVVARDPSRLRSAWWLSRATRAPDPSGRVESRRPTG